jgi:uncharacterized protein YbaR (Trm112 family)
LHDSSLKYLKCVKCGYELELENFEKKNEIVEGILECTNCFNKYPIISSIPFLIEDLTSYFSIRAKLGGYLMVMAKHPKIKSLIKKSLKGIQQLKDDTTDLEKNWATIYEKSEHSSFETTITSVIRKLPKCNFVIEHGCSIGTISNILTTCHRQVFGIDKSFFALLEAKKRKIENSDFFLADSLSHPFRHKKFDLVLALNVMELIEPLKLLKVIGLQTKRFVILADQYDFERGKNSVKIKINEKTLRSKLIRMGFKLIHGTNKPSFVSWNLNVSPRLELNYKVDIIVGEKILSS